MIGRSEAGPSGEELRLAAAVRQGDETAFGVLVDRHHAAVLQLALCFVPDCAAAEELAGDAWREALATLDEWDGISPLRAWILRALGGLARLPRPGARDGACAPAARPESERWPPARRWPEEPLASAGALHRLRRAMDELSPAQRAVVTMRDVARCDARATCAALGLSEQEQRALLQGGRARLRDALQAHVEAAASPL